MLRPKKRIWLRRFLTRLKRLDYVVYIYPFRDRLRIGFKGGLRRTYTVGKYGRAKNRFVLRPDSARAERIKIGYEHQWSISQDLTLKKYPLVHKSRLKQATDIERDLLIFDLAHRLMANGLLKPLVSHTDIKTDIQRIADYHPFIGGVYASYSTRRTRPGDMIIWSLCDIYDMKGRKGSLSDIFIDVKACARSLNRLIHKCKTTINIREILIAANRVGYGPKLVVPGFYIKLFSDLLKDSKSIYDYHPATGSKAIAAHMCGMSYNTNPEDSPRYTRLREYFSIPENPPDTAIIDFNFDKNTVDLSLISDAISRFNYVLVFIPSTMIEDAKKIKVPQRIIRVKASPQREYDFMLLYRASEKT